WNACSHGSGTTGSSSTAPTAAGALGLSSRLTSRALDLAFPPRNEPFDFRKQLEAQYQTVLKRTATSTFVDIEGDSVWTEEYLRYRLNACDHSTAVADVFTQINGAAAPAVCGCVFTISPTSQTVPAAGGNFSVQLTRTAGSCAWTAT